MVNKLYIFLIISIILPSYLTAQIDSDTIPDLPADQVEVIKNFRNNERDLKPIFQSPQLEEVKPEVHAFDYRVQIPLVDYEPPKPQIRPLAYNQPIPREIHDGYIDLSFGTPSSPRVWAGYHYNIEDWYEFGLDAGYQQTNDSEIEARDIEHTELAAFGSYALNKSIRVGANFDYLSENRYLFGRPWLELQTIQDSLKRTLDQAAFSGKISFDWYKDYGLLIDLAGSYQKNDLDRFGINESKSNVNLDLSKSIGDQLLFTGKINGIFYNYTPDAQVELESIKDNNWIFNPSLYFNSSRIHVEAGAIIASKTDNDLSILPRVNIAYSLNPKVKLLAGVQSKYNILDFDNLYQDNPFLSFNGDLTHFYQADKLISPYLGAGYQNNIHQVTMKIRYNFDDVYYHFSTTNNSPNYGLEQGQIDDYLSIQAEYNLTYHDLEAGFLANYSFLSGNTFLPSWETKLHLKYSLLSDQLSLGSTFRLRDKQQFRLSNLVSITNEYLLDLNFRIDYHFNNRFTIYGEVVNILDRSYEMPYYFEGYGRNFRGGLFVTF